MDVRFAIKAAIALPPAAALTLLLFHADQRVKALDPNHVRAAGYNAAVTVWNARQASAGLPEVVAAVGATALAAKPVLEAATARINQLETPLQDVAGIAINLRDTVAQVKHGAAPVLAHADELVVAAKPAIENAGKITTQVSEAMPSVRNTLDVVSENADLLGRCATEDPATGEIIGNQDCFANRAIPALKSVEQISTLLRVHAPLFMQEFHQFNGHADKLVDNIGGIAADGRILADGFVAPKKWYERLFNLVPAAEAGWTAWQAVKSSRK